MRVARVLLVLFALMWMPACSDENPASPAPADDNPPARIVDVFADFESAFNARDIAKYDALLDDDFVFNLSPLDNPPAQWDRAVEMEYMTRLLDPLNTVPMRCDSVYFDFNYPRLIPFRTYHPATAPDETWWSTTLSFDFVFDYEPGLTVASAPGNRAVFVIRNAGTEADPVWKLRAMYDLGPNDSLFLAGANDTLLWSLGRAKGLYRPQ